MVDMKRYFKAQYAPEVLKDIQEVLAATIPTSVPQGTCCERGCSNPTWCDGCDKCGPHCKCPCSRSGCGERKVCKFCGRCSHCCCCSPVSDGGTRRIELPYRLPYTAIKYCGRPLRLGETSPFSVQILDGRVLTTEGGTTRELRCLSQIPVKHFMFSRVARQSCYVDGGDYRILSAVWHSIAKGEVKLIDPFCRGDTSEQPEARTGITADGPTLVPATVEVSLAIQEYLKGWTCRYLLRSPSAENPRGGAQCAVISPPAGVTRGLPGWEVVDSRGRELVELTANRGGGLCSGQLGRLALVLPDGREVVVSEEDMDGRATHLLVEDALARCTGLGTGDPLMVGADRGLVLATCPPGCEKGYTALSGHTLVRLSDVGTSPEDLRYYQPQNMVNIGQRRLRDLAARRAGDVVSEEEIEDLIGLDRHQLRHSLTYGPARVAVVEGTGCYLPKREPTTGNVMYIRMSGRKLADLLGTSLVGRGGYLSYCTGARATLEFRGECGHAREGDMTLSDAICLSGDRLIN